jgi:hypothetical protein
MAILRRLIAVMMTLAILTACTPSPTSVVVTPTVTPPTPTAALTATCTGTGPTPAPRPCDELTKNAEQRVLEEQAKAVYQRYWKEYTRLLEAGGAPEATSELKMTVSEPVLSNVVSLLRFQYDKGWKPNPFVAKYTLAIRSDPLRTDAEVTVVACEDTTGSLIFDRTGQSAGKGTLSVQIRALKRIDGQLKIFSGESLPGGSPCPIS